MKFQKSFDKILRTGDAKQSGYKTQHIYKTEEKKQNPTLKWERNKVIDFHQEIRAK